MQDSLSQALSLGLRQRRCRLWQQLASSERSEPRVVENKLLSWKNAALGVYDCLDEAAIYGGGAIRIDHPFEIAICLPRISNTCSSRLE